MEVTTYTNLRQHLKAYLDKVVKQHTPLFVTRSGSEEVVILSKSDFESMQETLYLLQSPENAVRLHRALQEYKEGKGTKRNLIEE